MNEESAVIVYHDDDSVLLVDDEIERAPLRKIPSDPEYEQVQITELFESNKVVIPTSKTFWSQPKAASYSPRGVEIPADSYGTVVRARIFGSDGGKISISHFDCQIEATVAQLVLENGVPLIVTPSQIYRKFAQMSMDEKTTQFMENEVIESMDKLLKTPATLDFTQEIQNHTRLKRNPMYDYTNTVMEGTLITGIHVARSSVVAASVEEAESNFAQYYYKGRAVNNIFIIYSMPMYAVHDHMVNQIATFPSRLLNSPSGAGHSVALVEKREPSNSSRIVLIRRYLIVQIKWMKQNKMARVQNLFGEEVGPDRLSFSKIAENSDIKLTPRAIRTLRTNTERILNELILEKMIKSYAFYKKGRAIDGVEINF